MIELKDVRKSFGIRAVLGGVTLSISDGEIVFVIGKSGTGKSVLLKSIVGLLRIDSGEIWVDGEEVSRLGEEELLKIRRACGLVFQAPALLDSLDVKENVAFGLRAHRVFEDERSVEQRVAEVLEAAGLSASILSRMPSQLSFGMQKRVSLARTLALHPKYLLYDEPTTGLDPVATRGVGQLISRLARQFSVTSIVVSHDMPSALEIADRIVLLDESHIAEAGTPDEISRSGHPLVRAFLNPTSAKAGTR